MEKTFLVRALSGKTNTKCGVELRHTTAELKGNQRTIFLTPRHICLAGSLNAG